MTPKELNAEMLRVAKEQFRLTCSLMDDHINGGIPEGKLDLIESLRKRSEELWDLKYPKGCHDS